MARVNYRSKISVDLSNFSTDTDGTLLASLGQTITLTSVQSYNPQVSTNADVNDSISSERIGYLIRPSRLTIALTVLAAAPLDGTNGGLSDSEILQVIQFLRGTFEMTIRHSSSVNDYGNSWVWTDCMITDSTPSQLTIDGRPTATFNIAALGVIHEDLAEGGTD